MRWVKKKRKKRGKEENPPRLACRAARIEIDAFRTTPLIAYPYQGIVKPVVAIVMLGQSDRNSKCKVVTIENTTMNLIDVFTERYRF